MPWTEDGEYIFDSTSNKDNTGNNDYYTPGLNPNRDDVAGGNEYTYDSLGNLYKNGTLFRAVETPGDAVYNPKLPSVVPGIDDTGGISNLLKKLFVNKDGTLDMRALGATGGALAGLLGANKSTVTPTGYQGKIPQYSAMRNMVTAPQAGKRPGAGGTRYGGDVSYMPKGSSPLGGGLTSLIGRGLESGATQPVDASGNPGPAINPSLYEFYGGENGRSVSLRDMMKSINTPRGAPREIDTPEVMRTINPNERADAYASGGLAGRYLQGGTDGMADKIPAKIGEDQPAALSHGEFVIPADVVSHLGNGNSDAGAKKLYSMMDKIREARTGTKKQGKQINPDKFMPGGAVSRYAGGGITGAGTAANAGVTGTESNLSNWAGDYVTDMLGKGKALSEMPYQEYGGPLTAGASNLQNQAFNTAANLSVPGSVGTAAQTAGDIATKAQGINYAPTAFTNQFNAPAAYTPTSGPQYDKLGAGNVLSTFQAPAAYQTGAFGNAFQAPTQSAATNFTNQFTAPGQYQNTGFTSGTFGGEQAQKYMNPYLQQSLNPQLEEARRQAQITEQGNKAAMTRAGAYGGGRSAILAAENQRNLGTNLANITGKGYDTAYTNAMSQFNQDQARNMQAQQASEQSKQFGAGQSMTAADMMAKYGMSAQQAQEAARQFNQSQAMTGAQSAAQYGLAGQQATEASRQFGANQALQGATTAGAQGLQAALANQQAGLTAGQGNINAAMEAARQAEASRQFGSSQGMTAAQQAAQYGQAAQAAGEQSRQFGADFGLRGLNTALQAANTQGNLGISSADLGLRNLQQQLAAGATQRGIESEGIAADKTAFEEARANPYKMVQYQQSLLSGLPLAAQNINTAQPSTFQEMLAGAGGVAGMFGNKSSLTQNDVSAALAKLGIKI